jgi:hypothetical protein
MSIISQFHLSQQTKIKNHAKNITTADFIELLSNDELLSIVENNIPKYREQIYTPIQTLSMFLTQALNDDRSCSKAVNDLIIQNQLQDKSQKISSNTGAYCLARQKLLLPLLTKLTINIGETISQNIPTQWRWFGRSVRLIDGTTVSMPDTAKLQEVYPQPKSQKEGLGFPICRLLAVSCLHTGVILNASIGPCKGKGSDEKSLLRNVLDTFKSGDVVIGDAFFGSYFLLVEMMERGVDVLFEQIGSRRSTTDFGKGITLGKKDHLVDFNKPKIKPDWMTREAYNKAPDKITIRECKIGKKILITTMLAVKDYPKKALGALFKQRWHVEVDFRNLKTTLGLVVLSCKTPEMCQKEMWVYFLANNLIRLLMAQAAVDHNLLPRQLSFKHTVQIWNTYSLLKKAVDDQMLSLIAKRIVGNRPGRMEPRAVKRRPKPYKLLMLPRAEARQEIMENGHQKKMK